jgi:hypothetical protein
MDVVETLEDLADLVERLTDRHTDVFVRWSTGPNDDAEERSVDHASGLELPGLSVNTLTPPGWWTLPAEEWVARQVRAYAHLGDAEPDNYAWVLCGRVTDRGPDNEPLVVDVTPIARLAPALLGAAADREPQSPRPQDHAGR